jgi:hypothetical protein
MALVRWRLHLILDFLQECSIAAQTNIAMR